MEITITGSDGKYSRAEIDLYVINDPPIFPIGGPIDQKI
jgi:hypothetical protein